MYGCPSETRSEEAEADDLADRRHELVVAALAIAGPARTLVAEGWARWSSTCPGTRPGRATLGLDPDPEPVPPGVRRLVQRAGSTNVLTPPREVPGRGAESACRTPTPSSAKQPLLVAVRDLRYRPAKAWRPGGSNCGMLGCGLPVGVGQFGGGTELRP